MQKFSDRFLPRKVSKHEKRARAIHVKILEDFNASLVGIDKSDIKTEWGVFIHHNKARYLELYGLYAKKVMDIIQKQVDETKPVEDEKEK